MSQLPEDWDINIHEHWLADNKVTAVDKVFEKLNKAAAPKPKGLMVQAGFYLFFLRDYPSCITVLSHALNKLPNDENITPTLIVALSRNRQFEEAQQKAEAFVEQYPDNFGVWDSLSNIYYSLGLKTKAVQAGTKSLNLKDLAAGSHPQDWSLPTDEPATFCKNKKRVISYSLWGANPRYLQGALRNVLLAPDIYPGWELWFHVDSSVPVDFLETIKCLGAKVIHQPGGASIREKLCWRFTVCNAADVGYYLVRDADSVFGIRERAAVEAWLGSGKWFHVIRDWWTHTDLILAGLWGGVAGVLPNIQELLSHYTSSAVETPHIDQWFLRDCIWPYIKASSLIHDRIYKQTASMPLPGDLPDDNSHVGCCEFSQKTAFQTKMVAPWFSYLKD